MGGGAVGGLPWPRITWVATTATIMDTMAMVMDMGTDMDMDIMAVNVPPCIMETMVGVRAMDVTIPIIHTINIIHTLHIITHLIDEKQLKGI